MIPSTSSQSASSPSPTPGLDAGVLHSRHRDHVQTWLREFDRCNGIGNVKSASQAIAQAVRSLVAMMDTLPSGCGANCPCNGPPLPSLLDRPVAAPTAPAMAVAPPPTVTPATPDATRPVPAAEPVSADPSATTSFTKASATADDHSADTLTGDIHTSDIHTSDSGEDAKHRKPKKPGL